MRRQQTRRRRQKGGDKRLLYLALFAWILAVARVLGENTNITREFVVNQKVYDDAKQTYDALKNPTLTNTPMELPDTSLIEKAAFGLADLYDKSDKLMMQGVMKIAELSGESLVATSSALDRAFTWLGDNANALADKLEGKQPVLPLLEDAPAPEPLPVVTVPIVGKIYKMRTNYDPEQLRAGDSVMYRGEHDDSEEGKMYQIQKTSDKDDISRYIPVEALDTTAPVGGRRRKPRKTLRRKRQWTRGRASSGR